MTATIDTATRLAQQLYRTILLPVFALGLLVAMWSATLYQIGQERQAAWREAVGTSQSLARTLADHTGAILRQIEHVTQLFKLKYEETGGALTVADFSGTGGLLDSVLPARLGLPVARYDAAGKRVDSVNAAMPADIATQDYFRALLTNPADSAQFGTPLQGGSGGKWLIRTSRRLNHANGSFAGVIVIMIDPVYFVDDYDRLNMEENGALMLVSRQNGHVIGRIGERLVVTDRIAFRAPEEAGRQPEELELRDPIDRVTRLFSYRDMARFSLMAVVGISEPVAMARFAHRRSMYYGVTLLASVLLAAFAALLMQQARRLRESTRVASEAQAVLRAASDASLDGTFLLKAWRAPGSASVSDFIFTDVNQRAAAMLGLARDEIIGRRLGEVNEKLSSPTFLGTYLQVIASGQPLEDEYEVQLDSGQVRWLHRQIVPLDDGVAITSRDITARKQDELELRNNRSFLQSLIDNLPLLIYAKSLRAADFGQMVVWNRAAESVTGYSAARVIGQDDSLVFPSDFPLRDAEDDRQMMKERSVIDLPEKPFLRPDGTLRYLHTISVPVSDQDERTEYILCIAEDVTGRRSQEQALRQNQAELAAVNDASPLGLARADARGQVTYINRTFEAITGLTRRQAQGQGWMTALHDDDHGVVKRALEHLRTTHQPFQSTMRCVHADGKLAWLSVKIAAILIDGRIEGYVATVDDITTLRESELALLESESRLRTIANALPAMIAYIDADQTYRFHNLAYEREFGRGGLHMQGRSIREIVGDPRYAHLAPYIARVLAGETLRFEEDDEQDGVARCMEVNYIPQLGEDGVSVIGFHVMRQDITSQKREKQHLLKLSQIDALTGLANRTGFLLKLNAAMQTCQQHNSMMAVMYMDIDHFKPVNDTWGHHVGDALLKAFSARLSQAMRASDTIARLGGDEFTIIMENVARASDAENRAAKIVQAMQAPFELDGTSVRVSASIGVAFYRDQAMSAAALLKLADAQLYRAKQEGRNTYRADAIAA